MSIDPRVPPHDSIAEQCVLGCCLVDGEMYPKCRLSADDFYEPRNTAMWRAFIGLTGRGKPIDPITVLDELTVRGTLKDAGGPERIEELIGSVAAAVNAVHYADQVREKAEARELINLCRKGMEAGYLEQGRNGAVQHLIDGGTRIKESFAPPSSANWISARAIRAKPYNPPQHFLPNVIIDNYVTILYGPAKVGKDFFLFAWLRAFTTTGEFLGSKLPSGIGKVLYVSEESETIIRWRLEQFGVDTDKVEFLCRADSMSMGWNPLVEEAGRRAVKFGASVIVFNTLSALAGINEENEAGEGNAAMRPVLAMSDKVKKAVLVVHHTNKSTENLGAAALQMRGTTALKGAADVLVAFAYHQGNKTSAKREIYSEGRILPVPVTMMELDMTERPWTYKSGGTLDGAEESERFAKVLKWLTVDAGWLTVKALRRNMGEGSEAYLSNTMRAMHEARRVQRRGSAASGYEYANLETKLEG